MDLNRLYFHHQISLMRAAAATSFHDRSAHLNCAGKSAESIRDYQLSAGAAAASYWHSWLHEDRAAGRYDTLAHCS